MDDAVLFRDSSGRMVTRAEAERDFQKSLIVAGRELEGDAYDDALVKWLGTYHAVTPKEQRSTTAPVRFLLTGFAISAVLGFLAYIAGGGFIAMLIVFGAGAFVTFGASAFVALFTIPKRD